MVLKSDSQPFVVDGYALIGALFNTVYDSSMIPDVPHLVYQLHAGDLTGLSNLIPRLKPVVGISMGMNNSVECREAIPFETVSATDNWGVTASSYVRQWIHNKVRVEAELCSFWGAGTPDPVENQAVISDIPTLLVDGEFDPVTPPNFAQLAVRTLRHGTFVLVPATGQGTLAGGVGACAQLMAKHFLDDPSHVPGSTCPTVYPVHFH